MKKAEQPTTGRGSNSYKNLL